ncbi:MAG TPA: aminomethyl-transferring glycine dehydrogenase subunit GcvPB, partial [Smithellaceae bacterium]|jgi:glycine dehydrogenase subunit 2|nr:aminomethyl-transferring glycine dehydrogenase subunit GcvPB [Syntrophaceae bacterium]HNY97389.1 aminomethyl-transferring glycine dehydrogenase subunit GcvPB [Smithellaceae bacterium]MBP9532138.1 aminomethyl-transferring glycine dehydrogenase subunit GcvPB [Syntrophaceae bacterium]MBP9651270.1 aminomethyl-transferring glycine dehydrogenase subunit GcvPB [Syntrophaceae bacterium]HOH58205.1 aminomethyl-transferring glycine dehydrogenase subunit GcvPB [Smithellaceae bacterium]
MELLFEISKPGRSAVQVPASDVPTVNLGEAIGAKYLRGDLDLPEVAQIDLVRHYTNLSRRNFGVDLGFYPLGSCTMKYNPKINENIAALPGFTDLHPLAPEAFAQGSLELMYDMQTLLSALFGMTDFTLQPAAGAHGELTGVMMIKKYFEKRGEKRRQILIPDAAHGTNPASGALCGFETVTLRSNAEGGVDLAHLESLMTEDVAALMLTNPNTLGLFERNIEKVAAIVHGRGGLLYGDGANANAYLGKTRPGDLGFDVIQLNLHKTFSTPHGGGGPGSGPVGVGKKLVDFLPVPRVVKNGAAYSLSEDFPDTIGRVRAFYGNFNVIVKACAYLRSLGAEGLRRATEMAVLNANYIQEKLKPHFDLPYDRICMHECVFSGSRRAAETGVHTTDVAKRLIDFGYHPPTIYFPLIVPEAIMIEPTETESKETLDAFCDAMITIAKEAKENPQRVKDAPLSTPVGRLDEVLAARKPDVCWKKS